MHGRSIMGPPSRDCGRLNRRLMPVFNTDPNAFSCHAVPTRRLHANKCAPRVKALEKDCSRTGLSRSSCQLEKLRLSCRKRHPHTSSSPPIYVHLYLKSAITVFRVQWICTAMIAITHTRTHHTNRECGPRTDILSCCDRANPHGKRNICNL